MRSKIVPIFVAMVAIFVYLICDTIWGVTSDWQTNDILSLWQLAIAGLLFVTAFATVTYAGLQFDYGRKRDQVAREQSLSLIKHLLQSELETNKNLLAGEYKIWSEPDPETRVSHAIGVRPLKVSAFEHVSLREDLRYLKPQETLSKVVKAYDQIKDFNDILEWWFRRAVLGQNRTLYSRMAGMEVDLALLTWDQLGAELDKTRDGIREALEALQSQGAAA